MRRTVGVTVKPSSDNELLPYAFLIHIAEVVRFQCHPNTGFEDIIDLWVFELNKVKHTYADVTIKVTTKSIELLIPDHLTTLFDLQYS